LAQVNSVSSSGHRYRKWPQVEAVLRSDGLHPGPVTSDGSTIPLTAPASVIDRAFHVDLVRFRLPSWAYGVYDHVAAKHLAASR